MTIQQLLQAINECNNGQLHFNLGNYRSFLINKRWYPLRATVNRAREINGETELTTDRALLELCNILHYTRIEEVSFENNQPVVINPNETIEEIGKIATILKSLTD
jgi:hypothetical protein